MLTTALLALVLVVTVLGQVLFYRKFSAQSVSARQSKIMSDDIRHPLRASAMFGAQDEEGFVNLSHDMASKSDEENSGRSLEETSLLEEKKVLERRIKEYQDVIETVVKERDGAYARWDEASRVWGNGQELMMREVYRLSRIAKTPVSDEVRKVADGLNDVIKEALPTSGPDQVGKLKEKYLNGSGAPVTPADPSSSSETPSDPPPTDPTPVPDGSPPKGRA